MPSSCTTQTVGPDHLLTILENGNTNDNFGSNVETALDIEAAHGVATHVGMKYYAADCASTTPPGSGLTNAGCNGSDVGLEEAIEDAANDPTLHSVSNSWGFGGEAEWGAADPFADRGRRTASRSRAAAGTTFYFSTGDSGTYQSGFPSDSQYVVAVGGTSTYSTSNSAAYSTTTTWSGGGSWCSNVIARPSWQTGPGVAANASCPGRAIPDVSAVADPNTGVRVRRHHERHRRHAARPGRRHEPRGAGDERPAGRDAELRRRADLSGRDARDRLRGAGHATRWATAANYSSYFRDVVCGNTANPTSGPDGDAATAGWDAATGWGEPDWFNFSTGYAITLGATNLSVPPSLATGFAWSCAKTPSNSTERGFSCPSSSTCYAVGNASGGTPWYGKFLAGGAWGAVNTFFKSTDGGQTWFPSNSDMFSIACTSGSTCIEVGAGGRERRTTDSGATWSDVATAPGNNKPLTQVTCPGGSICYAVGDRGNAMKSTDGGATWSWLNTTDGNPHLRALLPEHVGLLRDRHLRARRQDHRRRRDLDVADDAGHDARHRRARLRRPEPVRRADGDLVLRARARASRPASTSCRPARRSRAPTRRSSRRPTAARRGRRQTSNARRAATTCTAISCLPGTTTCTAVGRGGSIVTTTDLATWTTETSGTTNMLNSVTLPEHVVLHRRRPERHGRRLQRHAPGRRPPATAAPACSPSVDCLDTSNCYATGKQGVTLATTNGGGSWTMQAGGGTTQQMNGISCPTRARATRPATPARS